MQHDKVFIHFDRLFPDILLFPTLDAGVYLLPFDALGPVFSCGILILVTAALRSRSPVP